MKNKKLSLLELIRNKVTQELTVCISCNACMQACPVTHTGCTIEALNTATYPDTPVSPTIQRFAFSCAQCKRCVPVCPVGLHRDEMMIFLRYKLRTEKPRVYKRYLAIRGPKLDGIARTAQTMFVGIKKKKASDLAPFMETLPTSSKPVLFYPGCYLYSPKTMRQTQRLLNHIGTPYNILGGLSTCCGIPHLLQGEIDRAEEYMNDLHKKIQNLSPSIVLTGCAECYEALRRIQETYHTSYEVLSVVEYLMRHQHKFPQIKIREKLTLHDSCRFTRHYKQGDQLRSALSCFGTVVEMPHAKEHAYCCYHWNHDYDQANSSNRQRILSKASQSAPTLVCACLTCYEEFIKCDSTVEILDIIQLFEEALNMKTEKHEQQ